MKLLLFALGILLLGSSASAQNFVGSEACASCHQAAYDKWRKSDHGHAMETASFQSVLGDFNNAKFDYFGTTSRFYESNGQASTGFIVGSLPRS